MKQLNYTTRLLCVSTVKHLHTFSDCAPLLSSCRDPTVYNAEKMVNFWSNALNSNIRNFEFNEKIAVFPSTSMQKWNRYLHWIK